MNDRMCFNECLTINTYGYWILCFFDELICLLNVIPGIRGGKRFKTEADRKRWERVNETPEQTRLRLEKQREHQSARRDGESESEIAARLQTQKQIQSSNRESQTDEQTAERLDKQREYDSMLRVEETAEQHGESLQERVELYLYSLISSLH